MSDQPIATELLGKPNTSQAVDLRLIPRGIPTGVAECGPSRQHPINPTGTTQQALWTSDALAGSGQSIEQCLGTRFGCFE